MSIAGRIDSPAELNDLASPAKMRALKEFPLPGYLTTPDTTL